MCRSAPTRLCTCSLTPLPPTCSCKATSITSFLRPKPHRRCVTPSLQDSKLLDVPDTCIAQVDGVTFRDCCKAAFSGLNWAGVADDAIAPDALRPRRAGQPAAEPGDQHTAVAHLLAHGGLPGAQHAQPAALSCARS